MQYAAIGIEGIENSEELLMLSESRYSGDEVREFISEPLGALVGVLRE